MSSKIKTTTLSTNDKSLSFIQSDEYSNLVGGITELLETARHNSARAVNSILTSTYWEIGHRIIEFEQKGEKRAEYGATVLAKLSEDLTSKFGRGFGQVNLSQMKKFYLLWPVQKIFQTMSEKSNLSDLCFPLPWSAYVRLLAVKNEHARQFYEAEALRGGWSVGIFKKWSDTFSSCFSLVS